MNIWFVVEFLFTATLSVLGTQETRDGIKQYQAFAISWIFYLNDTHKTWQISTSYATQQHAYRKCSKFQISASVFKIESNIFFSDALIQKKFKDDETN